MKKILEQIDGIIGNAFHLPKSDATDMLLSDLQDLREMVASQQGVQADGAICPDCHEPFKSHHQAGGKFFCKPPRR